MGGMYKERTFASADGLQLCYRDYHGSPAQAPVLCLPGLTRNSRDFEQLAEHLCVRRRVLAPDLRGRGRSAYDPDPMNYNPATYLGDVLALLSAAGVEGVVVIGTSLGGLLAMMLVVAKRDAVVAVVLNDVGPEVDPAGLERIQGYVGKGEAVATWDEAAAAVRASNAIVFPDFEADDWLAMAQRTYARGDDGLLRPDYDPRIAEPFSQPGGATPAGDLWPLWSQLGQVPTLAFSGELSDILAEKTLERMREEKPDLECVTVPRVGHAPLLTEPVCIAAIDRFLDTLE